MKRTKRLVKGAAGKIGGNGVVVVDVRTVCDCTDETKTSERHSEP